MRYRLSSSSLILFRCISQSIKFHRNLGNSGLNITAGICSIFMDYFFGRPWTPLAKRSKIQRVLKRKLATCGCPNMNNKLKFYNFGRSKIIKAPDSSKVFEPARCGAFGHQGLSGHGAKQPGSCAKVFGQG